MVIVCLTHLFIFYHYVGAAGNQSLKVETQNGWVVGRKIAHSLYGWNGIPYAKPPLGDLRFEPPQVPDNWTGTWNATYDRSECISFSISEVFESFINPSGDEDCLYINVYTPKPPQKIRTPLPVIVWFYGGGFVFGNSSYALYGPNALVEKNVIFVSFNYRLSIFGFISTNDSAAPGNTGLKDQVHALKWVRNNILAFGGDPNRVTIMGQSAGSASVGYMVLTPLTKGLFSKAIMESGSTLCFWALSKTGPKAATLTGNILGTANSSSEVLISELKKVPAKKLLRAASLAMISIMADNPLDGLVYTPVIEPASKGAVITTSSFEILRSGNFNHIPVLVGYNSAETYALEKGLKLLWGYVISYDLDPARLVPVSMRTNSSELQTVGREIKSFYTGNSGVFTAGTFLNFLSDTAFVRPIQEDVNLTSQYVTTYFYRFSYNPTPGALGAAHADELNYIFNSNYNSTTDLFVKKCIVSLWTNFVKYGQPTVPKNKSVCGGVNWKAITPTARQELYFVDINKKVTAGINPDKGNMTFWSNLFEEYANLPLYTY
ncbi:Carboxylesterase family [Popillia japonica]|uniref:Carboxylic ester hydrolase n=1 Tax=Popillia japonica TaxID=7064 RepID=A0AAW1L9M4_POPJA